MGFYAEQIFPWLLDKSLRGPQIEAATAALVAPVQGDVLELGFGSARTLCFYPPTLQGLWAIEPSQGMSRRARQRIAAAPFPVHLDQGAGEHLPYEAARFDHVVLALTLCSVADPSAVLREIRRVLKPDGELHVLEHGLAREARWQTWQYRLNPLQKIIACGCHLTRDPEALVMAEGGEWIEHRWQLWQELLGPAELMPIFSGRARFVAA